MGYIFQVLRDCHQLQSVTLPWTSIRYGSVEDWARLLDRVSSLGLLGVDLKQSQTLDPINHVDIQPLRDPKVSFHRLTRLKIVGGTNFMPICDEDLKCIARTATNLEELHVTGLSSVTSDGKFKFRTCFGEVSF